MQVMVSIERFERYNNIIILTTIQLRTIDKNSTECYVHLRGVQVLPFHLYFIQITVSKKNYRKSLTYK